MNKKIKIIIVLAVVLFIGIIILVIMRNKNVSLPENKPKGSVNTESKLPPESKIILEGIPETETGLERTEVEQVEVNDFTKSSVIINENNDVSIKKTNSYDILYLDQFSQFLITINDSPFEEIRTEAEIAFLNSLGINQEDACKLDVVVTTPHFANPEEAGTVYKLSFCD